MIVEVRKAKKMSQNDVASVLRVSQQSVSQWETGAREPPIWALIKLSDLFGCTIDELVRGGVKK